jgi:hypothetical protein
MIVRTSQDTQQTSRTILAARSIFYDFGIKQVQGKTDFLLADARARFRIRKNSLCNFSLA